MHPTAPLPAHPRRLTLVALAALVTLSTLLLAAAWSIRSEAGGRSERPSDRQQKSGFAYGRYDDDHGFSFALLDPATSTTTGTIHDRDWKALAKLRDGSDRELLWFAFDANEYVVRERAVIEKAKDLMGPMMELGRRQGHLGGIQAELGGQQAQLGGKQAMLGAEQARLSVRLTQLSLRDADDNGEEIDGIERRMQRLQRDQERLSREQEPLARRQEELGRQQAELGRQQELASKRAGEEMRRLAEDAIESGKAERLRN